MAYWDQDIVSKVANELFQPDLSSGNWELFVESRGFKLYRLYNEESGLYQYKIYGSMNVPPEICARVYMDLEYRKTWDSYVKELMEVREDGKEGVYWQINFPFMMSNRDYVFRRQYNELEHNGQKIWVVFAESEKFDSVPERKKVIRVADYQQKLVLMADNNGGTKAYMHYYDNPGGMIPTWLINWAAKTGVPSFLDEMEKACKGYASHLEKQGKQ